jgi:hypothetical protein
VAGAGGRAGGRGEVWMRGKARRGEAREGRGRRQRGSDRRMLSLQQQQQAAGRWREGSAGFPFWAEKGKPSLPPCPPCLPNFQTGSLGGEADPIPAPSAACLPADQRREGRESSLPPSSRSPLSFVRPSVHIQRRSSVGSCSVPFGGHTPSTLIRASRC